MRVRNLLVPGTKTWMHLANPVVKLVGMVLLFLMTLFTHRMDFMFYQMVIFTVLLFWQSGYAFWKIMIIVLSFCIVFISSSSSMILFGKGDTMWWTWGLIRISEESFFRGVHIGIKSVTFAAEGLLFVLTTPSVSLFYALMQKAKLPPKYAYSFMASIRLLPMVWEEFQIRRNALAIRGTKSSKGIRGWILQIKLYAVPMLAQSIRRAHRVAVAMESKAFVSDNKRTYYYPSVFTKYDPIVVIVLCVSVVAAFVLAAQLPIFGIEDVRYKSGI
ncbi:energy-coupling factor transport system permease protein [Fontibacillus panacisegetis]|uniref:Energy-coupling factor transport system permease protein n=1 Tax=Fontibacillus panacisegetis TaxID=670482 RepID=A0A1G7JXE0_9BACL|nr:energy-coupling factor transporter transmembrane component T [Fontibacillus panacisegetis]SDF29484.1 energy-coupling factor transport system permease protein [Fontibacillus panacisegetis]